MASYVGKKVQFLYNLLIFTGSMVPSKAENYAHASTSTPPKQNPVDLVLQCDEQSDSDE